MSNLLDEARKSINEIDAEMARLFEKRMRAAENVAKFKCENGMKIFDPAREEEVIKRNSALIADDGLRAYYVKFLKNNMALSREYQAELLSAFGTQNSSDKKTLSVNLGENSYEITVCRGGLKRVGEFWSLDRKVLVLTDSGVPEEYAQAVASAAKEARIVTVACGEGAKSPEVFKLVLEEMLKFEMGREDALVAVGGGVVGDLGGFCASAYMRGIDFYNVPTTLLSEVDSSIGGKTAINLGDVKNSVGAFYQPKGVLIDTDTLKTLPPRQIANGFAEIAKMAACFDAELFERLENESFTPENAKEIIISALNIKKRVVEEDEKEKGLRKALNFGHTLGHGIEAAENLSGLYHGECVALGMIPVASGKARERILALCKNAGLPMEHKYDTDLALSYITHDKKRSGNGINVVFVEKIGEFRIEKISFEDFEKTVREALNK